MSTNPTSLAYMSVKSSAQGAFSADASRAGHSRSLCHAVKFRGEVPHDVRKGNAYAVTQHQPIDVIREWSLSTVQFLTSLWNNEVLDEVLFEFIRTDAGGQEVVYATLTLAKATVAYVELRSGNTAELLPGEHRSLDRIGLHAEKIEFKVKDKAGDATANYDRKAEG
jgi:type VI secretion system Hcp family effector